MILRVAAVAALAIGIGLLLAFLHLLGKGPFAGPADRHLRAMKDRTAAPDTLHPYGFADFAALPHRRPLAEYAALERRGVSVEGFIRHLLWSSDGDYHLEIGEWPPGDNPGSGPYVTAEVTPQWRRGSAAWSFEGLAAALRPARGADAPWPAGPRRVRISGWLLYDHPYDEPHGPRQPRLTGWEVHPVTRIEVWDDSLAGFVEHRR